MLMEAALDIFKTSNELPKFLATCLKHKALKGMKPQKETLPHNFQLVAFKSAFLVLENPPYYE